MYNRFVLLETYALRRSRASVPFLTVFAQANYNRRCRKRSIPHQPNSTAQCVNLAPRQQYETSDERLVFSFYRLWSRFAGTRRRETGQTKRSADHVGRLEYFLEWIRAPPVQDTRVGSAGEGRRQFSKDVLPISNLRSITFVTNERTLSLQHG